MSPWKRDTPARVTEGLVREHEDKRNSRILRNHLAVYRGMPRDVREVTGQDPITEDDDE